MARILVIDDDSDVRALICGDLRSAGHDVTAAADGAQGLALQRQSPAELVVTDIFMPEKEGIETIRELKQEYPAVKIIAISGGGRLAPRYFTTHELDVVASELGVCAVLHKPFESSELLSTIESALRR